MKQDYSLLGQSGKEAIASGLLTHIGFAQKLILKKYVNWYQTRPAPNYRCVDMAGLLVISGSLAVYTFPSWWGLPFWLIYGVLYSSASDARWHECGHSTAFKTPWKNELIYQIASFFCCGHRTCGERATSDITLTQ